MAGAFAVLRRFGVKNVSQSVLAVLVVVASNQAWGQVPPFTRTSQPYAPLVGATNLPILNSDEGIAPVVLPFGFPFNGATYQTVYAHVNGQILLSLPPACMPVGISCTTYSAISPIPTAAGTIQNHISAFWDDLEYSGFVTFDGGSSGGSAIRVLSTPAKVTIEWADIKDYAGSWTASFQVSLEPTGNFSIHYGPITGTGALAVAGYQSGGVGFAVLGATCSTGNQAGCCGSASNTVRCTHSNYVADMLISTEPPLLPDLIAQSVRVSNFQTLLPSNDLSMSVTIKASNYSRSAANNWSWRAFLSPDAVPDLPDGGPLLPDGGSGANDIPLTPESGGNSLAAQGAQDFTATFTTSTAPPPGEYFVIVQLDSQNTVTEASEVNNVAVLPYSITGGVDVVATAITGVAVSGPSNQDSLRLQYFNRGASAAGTINYRVLLSTNRDAGFIVFPDGGSVDLQSDGGVGSPLGLRVIHQGTRAVSGGETVDENISVTMPADAPQGEFFYALQLDPAGRITESNKRNNVVFSVGRVDVKRADLLLESVDIIDTVTRQPTRDVLFGEGYRAIVRLRNQGGSIARNYRVGVILSNDNTLSLLSDSVIAEEVVAQTLSTSGSTNLEIPFTLPLVDRADAGLQGGLYYFFVFLDTLSTVVEANKVNNSGNVGPVRALAPAPDYALSALQAPASAGVGEVIPVFRTIRNIGNRPGESVPYRYYASANTIVTASDVPLEIQYSDGGVGLTASLALGKGQGDSRTELVRLPNSMPAGSYSVGCLVDPANTVVELSKSNNSFASNAVQVVPSSLRVVDVQLPDATIGRSYFYRLGATGETGASIWDVDQTQGDLPTGLTLNPSTGELSGAPSVPGVRSLTVRLTNNGRVALGRMVMRVLPSTSQVEITTASIPAIVNSSGANVQYPLGAAGGSRPYVWRLAQGSLPAGLTFGADGVLGGAPRAGTPDGTTRLTFEVSDATGGSNRRALELRLVAAGSIVLRTPRLPDAIAGQDYMPTEIAVQNADGSMLARPLSFRITGALPPGLTSQEEFGVFTVSGRPTRAGTFTFTISVEDARGRSDSLDYTVNVYTNRFRIVANNLPQIVRPGDAVTASFTTQPSAAVKWSVVSGALPPGVTLNAAGELAGAVEDLVAAVGTFTFVVEARSADGATGLAPFALSVERPPATVSCSSTGTGSLGLLALVLTFLFKKSRRRLAPFLVAGAMVTPVVSVAQTYQASVPTQRVYQPLPSNRTVFPANMEPNNFNGARISLPFTFKFYNQPYAELVMSKFGYLAFANSDSSDSFNRSIPHNLSFSVDTFIAPWWDSLEKPTGTSANFAWTVTGSSPNRIVIVEWRDMGTSTSTPAAQRVSFQVQLFETTNQIRFSYGPTQPPFTSGSVGIQGARTIGLSGLPCTMAANCTTTDWPSNQSIDFFYPPDLKVARLTVDQTGYAGVRYGATAFVRNDGGRVANNIAVRFFLSTDAVLDTATDAVMGDAMLTTLAVGEETPVAFPGTIPSAVTTGSFFVLAVVDPSNSLPEIDENNNQSPPVSMQVGAPRADLSVAGITAPALVAPGAMVMIGRTISNVGNSAAPAFKYTYLLSDNNVISISDRALSPVGESVGLMAGASDMSGAMVALPANLAPGTYWLGVCVNFDGANATAPFPLDEISVVNNCAVASAATIVSTGNLSVLTTSLPTAIQYAPYGLRLRAIGGTGDVTWALSAGTVPPGMMLGTDGMLSGAPARAGSYGFEVRATSGAATATQTLSLMVTNGTLPLVIVDQDLPGAEFARSYSASLVAIGGKPPYEWTLRANAVLPDGLALSGDGYLEGRATESGEKVFGVEITDSAGAKAARELRVRVVNPTTLSIGTTALARGVLRQSYLQRLVVVGGRAPYQWTVTRFQQLPQNPTESPGPVQMGLPESFGLTIQDGVNEDFLSGTPKQSGLYSLTMKVVDGNGTEDTVSLTLLVVYADALAITTTVLPDAFINQSYAVKLSHNSGRDSMVTFSLPCIRQAIGAEQFECVAVDASQSLPPGLALGPDGSILGIPSGAPATFTFLVKVIDEGGRQDIRGLSIRVQPDFATSETRSGCSASGELNGSLLALLGVILMRRRRS
jgi:subtilase family serine protease